MRESILHIAAAIIFVISLCLPTAPLESAVLHGSPFRYTGDGILALHDMQTGESLSLVYRTADGAYEPEALEAIDYLLRCHGDGTAIPISLKLVELMDYLQDHFEVAEIRVVSGYRSRRYNRKLRRKLRRVARESLHSRGLAMDIRLPGVKKSELAAYARDLQAGGVGLYRSSQYVHIDVGEVRSW